MSETLFDPEPYEDGSKRKAPEPTPEKDVKMVRRPPGYYAITSRTGPKGFHRTKISAEMTKYHSVETLCGIVGRRITGYYPSQIVLCEECELKHWNK